MKLKSLLQTLSICAILVLLSQPSWAHKVRIFAWETGEGTISCEAKFSGGRPAQKATVSVIDRNTKKELASGTTNEEGLYTFPIPVGSSGDLELVVDAGDGHKNYWKHKLSDQTPATTPTAPATKADTAPTTSSPQKATQTAAVSPPVQQSCNQEEFSRLIETALDKKLAPIRKSLAENSENGPSLQDILGGIGYIFGLAGMAALIQSRKNNRGKE